MVKALSTTTKRKLVMKGALKMINIMGKEFSIWKATFTQEHS